MSLVLTKAFIAGLSKVGLTYDEIVKWRYCGGNKDNHDNYWRLVGGNESNRPDRKSKCICDWPIQEQCYITEDIKTLNRILVIGNCCIKRFIPNSGRTCGDCGNLHRNRNYNLCNDCKPKPCKSKNVKKRITVLVDTYWDYDGIVERIKTCSNCRCELKYNKCYACSDYPNRVVGKCVCCNAVIANMYATCFKCKSK